MNLIRLVSIKIFKQKLEEEDQAKKVAENQKLDEEDQAKKEAEEEQEKKRKRYENLFRIKKNGCEKYMLTLALHERNLESIKVKEFLDCHTKVIIKNKLIKDDLLVKIKTDTEPDSLERCTAIPLLE